LTEQSSSEPQKIPVRPVDLAKVIAGLEDSYAKNTENLNKPILTIAPSSIAATIAFVGATSEKLDFGIVQSIFLLASWLFWLLSVIVILVTYMLKAFSLEKPLHWAKQFAQLDFESANLEQMENSVLRNRTMFEPNAKVKKWTARLQIAAPVFFALGFIAIFGFLIVAFLFKS